MLIDKWNWHQWQLYLNELIGQSKFDAGCRFDYYQCKIIYHHWQHYQWIPIKVMYIIIFLCISISFLITIYCFLTDGTIKALKIELSLPQSCYATMALREILKIDTSAAYQATLNHGVMPDRSPTAMVVKEMQTKQSALGQWSLCA